MKNKKLMVSIIIVIVFVLIGGIAITQIRNNRDNEEEKIETSATKAPTQTSIQNKKILVTYFSVPETDKTENLTQDEENSTVQVNGKSLGNTQYVANLISEETNSDLYRIEPVNAYPTNHKELLDRAIEEMKNNDRPEIKNPISNLSEYDVVFIGYPIWNSDLPPIIYSFLESNNFDGKTIIPFCTHGGSGLSNTVNTIQEVLPNADVISNGFSLSRDDMDIAPREVTSWLKSISIE